MEKIRREKRIFNTQISEKIPLISFRYSKDSNNKVTVDYTPIKFVKKMPGGKPGMVNYTNYKTIIVNRKTEK